MLIGGASVATADLAAVGATVTVIGAWQAKGSAVFLAYLGALAASAPHIDIERKANGFVARVATFDLRQQVEVDSEIERLAAGLCGHQQVQWGRFSSFAKLGKNAASDPAPVSGYFKEFTCVVPAQESYQAAPADWKASTKDQEEATSFFNDYYARRDRGDFKGAYSMFQPGILGEEGGWAKEMAASNKRIGEGRRRVTGITWYVNPDGAPHPGIYVAIDFVGEFPSAYFYCGYLALYRRGPGSYAITREEQNMFTHGEGTPDAAQVAQMRASMCRE
jgi:hypothetical protein